MIGVYEYHTTLPWPTILIFGAIHGNETCGTRAIMRLQNEIEQKKRVVKRGTIVFVPICHPRAYTRRVRFVEENLNRVFLPLKHPHSYEAKLANILCTLVARADILLDVHSISAKGKPFFYLDKPDKAHHTLGALLGVQTAIIGWPELYERLPKNKKTNDTVAYAHAKGKTALILEAGQHADPRAADVAYRAIVNVLIAHGLFEGKAHKTAYRCVTVERVYFRSSKNARFAKSWTHLQKVKKGTMLIHEHDAVITAPNDGYIIMPNAAAPVGDDWLYFGR